MANKLISDILEQISNETKRTEKINILQKNKDNAALAAVLQATFDERIIFELPEGAPPYKVADDMVDNTAGLYREFRKFYIFTKNQRSAAMKPAKREQLFIEMLESIHPKEAKLLLAMKDKTMPYKGITKKLVLEAYGEGFVK